MTTAERIAAEETEATPTCPVCGGLVRVRTRFDGYGHIQANGQPDFEEMRRHLAILTGEW